jgi:hypothetical protein
MVHSNAVGLNGFDELVVLLHVFANMFCFPSDKIITSGYTVSSGKINV